MAIPFCFKFSSTSWYSKLRRDFARDQARPAPWHVVESRVFEKRVKREKEKKSRS